MPSPISRKYLPNTCRQCFVIIPTGYKYCGRHLNEYGKCDWCRGCGYTDDPLMQHALGDFNILIHFSELDGDEYYWKWFLNNVQESL